MRHFMLAVLFLVASHCSFAQSSNGYIVAGAGSRHGKLISQAAFGGESVIHKRIGVGAEIGAIAGHQSFATFSANGYYHPPVTNRERVVDPFITAGYTAAVGLLGFEGNLVNFGGGVVYWFRRRIGLRVEFRGFEPARIYGFRAGITIR